MLEYTTVLTDFFPTFVLVDEIDHGEKIGNGFFQMEIIDMILASILNETGYRRDLCVCARRQEDLL